MWNMHDFCISGMPRTNNSIEGWHNALGYASACRHPSIWKLIELLKKEHRITEMKIAQYRSGGEISKQKRKYRKLDERISSLVSNFYSMSLYDFLRAVAHNYNF